MLALWAPVLVHKAVVVSERATEPVHRLDDLGWQVGEVVQGAVWSPLPGEPASLVSSTTESDRRADLVDEAQVPDRTKEVISVLSRGQVARPLVAVLRPPAISESCVQCRLMHALVSLWRHDRVAQVVVEHFAF